MYCMYRTIRSPPYHGKLCQGDPVGIEVRQSFVFFLLSSCAGPNFTCTEYGVLSSQTMFLTTVQGGVGLSTGPSAVAVCFNYSIFHYQLSLYWIDSIQFGWPMYQIRNQIKDKVLELLMKLSSVNARLSSRPAITNGSRQGHGYPHLNIRREYFSHRQ